MIGETVFHYRILDLIGEGGMGVVYRAEDIKLRRIVALKFLSPTSAFRGSTRERIMKEAQAAASLDHQNICAIHEVEELDDRLFIVMAYCEGSTLADLIRESRPGFEKTLDILIQTTDGLEAAHDQGIVHRDIKPANIIVSSKGRVKIMDFGLAKQSGTEAKSMTMAGIGTLAYMSPEQVRGDEVDQRSDIWSVGVLMYEILTGQKPFEGDYDASILYSIVNEPHKPVIQLEPIIPKELDSIIERSLRKSPSARYASIGELRRDLIHVRNLLFGEPEPSTTFAGYLPADKNKLGIILTSSFAILAAAALFVVLIRALGTGTINEKGTDISPVAEIADKNHDIIQAGILYEQGRSLYNSGKQHEGIPLMEHALDLNPRHLDALRTLVIYYSWAEDYDRAGKYARRAKEIAFTENNTRDYLFCNAVESFSLGEWEMAIKYYSELYQFEPDNLKVPLMIGYIKSKYIGDFTGAIEQCELIMRLDPHDDSGLHGRCHDYIGTAMLHIGKFNEALESYERYRKLQPDSPDPYTSLANAYRFIGQYNKAYELYSKQQTRKNPGFPVHEGIGRTCLDMGRWREAIEHFNRYIGSVSTNGHKVNGHLHLAHIYFLQRDGASLETEIEKALSINPKSVKAHWIMGLKCLYLDGDIEGARNELFNMNKFSMGSFGVDNAAQHEHLRGLILMRENRIEGAFEALQEAIRLSPRESYFFRKQLASALIEQRRYEEALDETAFLFRFNNNDPELLMMLCEAHRGTGNTEIAREYYKRTLTALESADKDFAPLVEFMSSFALRDSG